MNIIRLLDLHTKKLNINQTRFKLGTDNNQR